RPLVRFQQQLGHITETLDLSQRLETHDQAELGELARQTNSLLERLSKAIHEVFRSSGRLTESANRLAYTAGLVNRNNNLQQEVSQSMAAAVEQMSSSVAEITSTMEELSASSTQIADHSQSVVDVANLTLDNSRKGADAMQQLQQQMTEIHRDNEQSLHEIMELGAKSRQISKVMDLINTLADQTKLIAFNAALEASSAGESGKRFSVVAGEIRRLADSVTDSTREIEDRIQEIQDSISRLVITSEKGSSSIQAGMQVSSATAEDLSALVRAASQTSSAAQQISMSTKQQKTASSQVVIALRDIANASAHNAQSVRNITAISEEMINMAARLDEVVRAFQLVDGVDGEQQ
ncbi:methyl-accepting chemotaxis protein, partial [Marinospirillum alkaliphilum]